MQWCALALWTSSAVSLLAGRVAHASFLLKMERTTGFHLPCWISFAHKLLVAFTAGYRVFSFEIEACTLPLQSLVEGGRANHLQGAKYEI